MDKDHRYESIDEVFEHFRMHRGVILTSEEMEMCGVQYLCNEKGLWIIDHRISYDKRVPVFNTKYDMLANLMFYEPTLKESAIDIIHMTERPKYGER